METLGVLKIKEECLDIEIRNAVDGLLVYFKGEIGMENSGKLLDPLFNAIHIGALSEGCAWVSADVRELTFLNSSGIKALAKWIVRTTQAGRPYRIRLLHNPRIAWQPISLRTLTFLSPGSVTME